MLLARGVQVSLDLAERLPHEVTWQQAGAWTIHRPQGWPSLECTACMLTSRQMVCQVTMTIAASGHSATPPMPPPTALPPDKQEGTWQLPGLTPPGRRSPYFNATAQRRAQDWEPRHLSADPPKEGSSVGSLSGGMDNPQDLQQHRVACWGMLHSIP